MRIAKSERRNNALKFYNVFMHSNCNKAAIVVNKVKSNNPNINRCQFLTVPSSLAYMEEPVVIAESTMGIDGCFKELLGFLNNGYEPMEQKSYFDNGFNEWLDGIYGFRITYKDGLVFMLERQ